MMLVMTRNITSKWSYNSLVGMEHGTGSSDSISSYLRYRCKLVETRDRVLHYEWQTSERRLKASPDGLNLIREAISKNSRQCHRLVLCRLRREALCQEADWNSRAALLARIRAETHTSFASVTKLVILCLPASKMCLYIVTCLSPQPLHLHPLLLFWLFSKCTDPGVEQTVCCTGCYTRSVFV